MANQYTPAANVPAGGEDTSDRFGPYITGSGQSPAVIPGYPASVAQGDQFNPPTGPEPQISVPRAVFHDNNGLYVAHSDMTADSSNPPNVTDHDGDDGLPDVPRYEGPLMGDVDSHNVLPAPMMNPSAGNQGPQESGMTDINPMGPAPVIGNSVTATQLQQVLPDTTVDNYPRGADRTAQGPRG